MKNQFQLRKITILILFLGIAAMSTYAQGDVSIPVGDIPSGQQITITYDATVNNDLPQGLLFIENQGLVTGSNFDGVYSDDPDTDTDGDETLTPVGFTLGVLELPSTGESPWWWIGLISLMIAGMLTMSIVLLEKMRAAPQN